MQRILDTYSLLPTAAPFDIPSIKPHAHSVLNTDPLVASDAALGAYLTPPVRHFHLLPDVLDAHILLPAAVQHTNLDLSPPSAIPLPLPRHQHQQHHQQQDDALESTQISISTQFYPGAPIGPDPNQDLVLHSLDGVFFYVHSSLCRLKSTNNLGGLLPPVVPVSVSQSVMVRAGTDLAVASASFLKTPILTPSNNQPSGSGSGSPQLAPDSPTPASSRSSLSDPSTLGPSTPPQRSLSPPALQTPTVHAIPESSAVLNLVLHIIYSLPFSRYNPNFTTLARSLPLLRQLGLDPSEELAHQLLAHASSRPLEVYTLAAKYKMHDLAVLASQHTLSVNLSCLTDAMSEEMGPLYLKWLFFLHLGRAEALKRILVQPLDLHPLGFLGGTCKEDDRTALSRAWGLTTAYVLSTDNLQNCSVGMINSTYGSLFESVRCAACKERLRAQVARVGAEWAKVQMTI